MVSVNGTVVRASTFHFWYRGFDSRYGLVGKDKFSSVGMQQPEKYKENFDVSGEDPRSVKAVFH
jgi:hypothetical protein